VRTAVAEANQITNDFHAPLKRRRPEIEARYRTLTPRSGGRHVGAQAVFPGGFTRDAVLRCPYAAFIERGLGSVLTDADSGGIVDFWFNATSLPLGHCRPVVWGAASAQLRKGTAFFGPGRNCAKAGPASPTWAARR
jgi:glutamate-1-semialdehyde aminotransferase